MCGGEGPFKTLKKREVGRSSEGWLCTQPKQNHNTVFLYWHFGGSKGNGFMEVVCEVWQYWQSFHSKEGG